MELRANSSNNTIYADADGNIAYFHPQFVPKRDDRFEWARPVDGSDPATEWKGLHEVEESPFLKNPSVGWIQNTNNWPYSAAGPDSPKREAYPRYMDAGGENPRGVHAIRVLENRKDFTIDRLIAAAYDPWLPAFADAVPPLVAAYDALGASDPLKAKLAEPVAAAAAWDHRWGDASVPTSLAVFWGRRSGASARGEWTGAHVSTLRPRGRRSSPRSRCGRPVRTSARGARRGGRSTASSALTGDIVHPFSDAGAEHPGGVHVVAMGLARLVRRAALPGHEAACTARAATASWQPSSSGPTALGRAR
jgi:acyl-homoserine-lactone acylase